MRLLQEICVSRARRPSWSVCAVGLLVALIVSPILRSELSAQVDSSVPSSQVRIEQSSQQQVDKTSLIVTENYIIGPEDVLEITVWRNADLSKVVTVRPDGKVSLPLIGDVEAVGKSAGQLAELIAARLKEYKENPQVSIVVQQVNSYAIYVMGEIVRPGKFPLKSKTTLLQAITLAGGFTPNAARNKLVVFRFGEKGQKDIKIKASYDDIILRDSSPQNIELKPGDTIVVPSETMVLVP
jgi:polysaccharide export outer membrane protein